ncbi:phosphatase domain-containing putative toxin [Pseudoprimorskyibacter insulae]|uniref:Tyrosine specific protein phosphatases domain-containing protein n=1 Tax=Pseudoprimorskyibacter insulae TaxID=1695997 RepID=A0A2R8APR0_9RHOB|nr:protein-tyrosine phosphatase family protein [Pseudoprimorskyibacter insulae]SPF77859.1 hypothetical protein PRI8871_00445 [Pseudoprimorskyibacter insulae]
MDLVELPVGTGLLGLMPIPGRDGELADDLVQLAEWAPRFVVSLTGQAELAAAGLSHFGELVEEHGASWLHMPITDMGVPDTGFDADWPANAQRLRNALDMGQRVAIHCHGGCGRTGMIALRLMVEEGEDPQDALTRLRDARPCAVETEGQLGWALQATA